MAVVRAGLTGGIAAGKSEVARQLAAHGALVIDADVLAREALAPATPGALAVAERFGEGVLAANGSVDRAALAKLVFSDAAARADLNAIVHPLVRAAAAAQEAAAAGFPIVVHDIPLLVETAQHTEFDVVIVVAATPEVQLHRLIELRGLSRADADARLAAQASLADRIAVADHVIDNNGSLADLRARVDQCWAWLSALALAREA